MPLSQSVHCLSSLVWIDVIRPPTLLREFQDASNGSYASLVLGNAGLAVIATLPQYRRRERSNAFLAGEPSMDGC